MKRLAGRRVLIVEDEFFVAAMAADAIESEGGEPVGPCPTVESALQCIANETIDAALLDVNLNGTRSEAVAAALRAKGIPFVTATGYGPAAAFGGRVLNKPFSEAVLVAELERVLSGVL